jgi:hypothetical protein
VAFQIRRGGGNFRETDFYRLFEAAAPVHRQGVGLCVLGGESAAEQEGGQNGYQSLYHEPGLFMVQIPVK